MVLICTPPDQAERILVDCQPSLMRYSELSPALCVSGLVRDVLLSAASSGDVCACGSSRTTHFCSIPRSIQIDPVWSVLVAFDHPIFTPFDVLFVEEDACEPIRSAFRESSRYASFDPMKDMQKLYKASKQSIFYPDPPRGIFLGSA